MSVFGPASVKAKIQTVIGTDVQRAADLLAAALQTAGAAVEVVPVEVG
jgi:hypothetical protein